ncbi:MAG: ABC transporter ATP-binding protein [Planctomycetaceae bacterium]|jgi:branched-chain amino acid transport system ATP-binding protein
MTLLHLQGLVAGYGPIRALDDVSLEVDAGETVAIVGANGAGKTSLLMAISGLVPLRSGQIRYQGRPLAGVAPHEIARAGIGHVPEGRRIFPYLTVRENLELGGVARRERAGLREDIAAACDLFPVLASRMRQLGGTLSGGEQQMLAIARALVGRPRLVLLDEPSLGLAPLMVEKVFAAIASLGTRGIAVVLVEQNARASLRLATRAHVLEHGRIVLSGAGDALAADPRVRAAYLGEL